MSTSEKTLGSPGTEVSGLHQDNYFNHSSGIMSWLFTLDHKRIGVMYLASILSAFFLGGMLALLVRTELLTPGKTIVDPDFYNQLFTLHGAVMIFLFIIPGIPAALGNLVLPLMLGAKDVAFPRLNLASWWMWITGALFSMTSMILGAVDTGWTFYTPYSTTTSTAVISMLTGVFILGFSSIFTGLNFIVTIHKLRPKVMTWFKMPLFLWGLYGTAVMQVLATPVLGITGLLLIAERAMGVGIFDPALGGDPVLFQHFFWFYSHPAVYIMILPAMGVISELISVFSRRHIFGYRFIAFSSIAIAILSFLVWGHHMFTGMSPLANMVFSLLTFSVSIPSAIKIFNWLATMYKGAIVLKTPMYYALAFLFLFTIGGLTGLFLGMLSVDIHLHDTYFVVAHFHYVMFGGTVIAFMGGLHYWWPKMFGRMYNEASAKLAFWLIVIGFNITFLSQFVMGSQGMPRRYYDYLDKYTIYHQISTVGSYIMAAGFFVSLFCLLHSLYRGRPAPANPWGANSLEWKTPSPPPHDNFKEIPEADNPYDFSRWEYDPAIDAYVHDSARS
ncbi:MAG: cytochrome c oxidase subunit I [Acidobacteriota bacterium]|nr:cytochrome c oxidase subunit I [Acidobacteriota bacterium]MDH3784042.1 cytochrome c oxidase subunit I [Acidobacteriota bacterium]